MAFTSLQGWFTHVPHARSWLEEMESDLQRRRQARQDKDRQDQRTIREQLQGV